MSPSTVTLTVRLPLALVAELDNVAAALDRSRNWVIRNRCETAAELLNPRDSRDALNRIARNAGDLEAELSPEAPDPYRLNVSGRPQAHHWRVIDPNGAVVAEGGPVLTPGAATRKATQALDDKLSAGNYRLEVPR